MATWPSTVPSIAASGTMRGKPFRAPLETDMEDGLKRRRRSSTKNIATYSFAVQMTSSQFSTFREWVRDDLVDGVLSFTAEVYTPEGVEDRVCTFAQPYEHDAGDGITHTVSLSLDIEDY